MRKINAVERPKFFVAIFYFEFFAAVKYLFLSGDTAKRFLLQGSIFSFNAL